MGDHFGGRRSGGSDRRQMDRVDELIDDEAKRRERSESDQFRFRFVSPSQLGIFVTIDSGWACFYFEVERQPRRDPGGPRDSSRGMSWRERNGMGVPGVEAWGWGYETFPDLLVLSHLHQFSPVHHTLHLKFF